MERLRRRRIISQRAGLRDHLAPEWRVSFQVYRGYSRVLVHRVFGSFGTRFLFIVVIIEE